VKVPKNNASASFRILKIDPYFLGIFLFFIDMGKLAMHTVRKDYTILGNWETFWLSALHSF